LISLEDNINKGLEIISALDADSLTALEIRDILYSLVSRNYDIIDSILAEAIERGLVTRSERKYHFNQEASGLDFEKPTVRVLEEVGNCVLCGKRLTKCCYVVFPSRTYGPFGLGCVRKVHLSQ